MKSQALHRFLLPLVPFLMLLAGSYFEPPESYRPPPPAVVAPRSYTELQGFFAAYDYDLGNLEAGVPRILVRHLPTDLAQVPMIEDRKRLFVQILLPMVLMTNEEIAAQRKRLNQLLSFFDRAGILDEEDAVWLTALAADYRVTGDPLRDSAARTLLLHRVDVLPPSLVLAQAANESGWGTSRFAHQANNLFGEWTFVPGTGLVPRERPAGLTYEVRQFESIYHSLRSYMKNLNTHLAYRPLRETRARLRAEGKRLTGLELAAGLVKYSVRGQAYVKDIRLLIHQNRLSLLSSANLRKT